jgi:hypothetical protein
LLAAGVSLVAIGIVYWRLYCGIDFTDESFYVAVPYRLVLGARPFVDEISVTQQTAAIVAYPFVWVYDRLAGSRASCSSSAICSSCSRSRPLRACSSRSGRSSGAVERC